MKRLRFARWQARLCGSMVTGIFLLAQFGSAQAARPSGKIGEDWGTPKGKECVECHMTENPGLYWEWNNSQHGQSGVNCLDCHATQEGDTDGWEHEGQMISVIVTPKDCSKCHTTEFEEMWAGTFHADKADNTPHLFDYDGTLVESYFSPSDLVAFEVGSQTKVGLVIAREGAHPAVDRLPPRPPPGRRRAAIVEAHDHITALC